MYFKWSLKTKEHVYQARYCTVTAETVLFKNFFFFTRKTLNVTELSYAYLNMTIVPLLPQIKNLCINLKETSGKKKPDLVNADFFCQQNRCTGYNYFPSKQYTIPWRKR